MDKFNLFRISLILVSILYIAGCDSTEKEPLDIVIVVPNDYRGPFVIKESSEGEHIKTGSSPVELLIPETGVLLLKDLSFLYRWHHREARYESGEALASGMHSEGSGIYFFSLWSDSDGGIFYFVGSPDEFDALNRAGPWEVDKLLPRSAK